MRHFQKTQLLGSTALLELKGEDEGADEIVNKALEDLTKTMNDRLEAIEKKADSKPLADRLDKLEAKANRPNGGAEGDEPTVERKAFASYLRRGENIGADEIKALNASNDAQGGYLAPPEFSTEMIRDLVEFSPIRNYASVRTTGVGSVLYPKRVGATNAAWVTEVGNRPESEIGFDQLEVAVHELATFVEISKRLVEDTSGMVETEVRSALAEDFGQKEAQAFLFGDGVGKPSGLMVDTGIAETSVATLGYDALVDTMHALPAAYRNRGVWAMNGSTLAALRKIKDSAGWPIWQGPISEGAPELLLGRPVVDMVDMEDPEGGNSPIIFGDFSGYRIVDRLAMSVLVDPYTRAKNGINVYHARRRVGGGVIQSAKFRKLSLT